MNEMFTNRFYLETNFYIDFEQSIIMKNGTACSLTSTEWKLLLYLAKNQGRIVRSQELQSFVWNTEDIDEKHDLYTCISRVRKKTARESKAFSLLNFN